MSIAVGAFASLIALSGCASPATEPAGDGIVSIVASTNVYGDIAAAIAGDHAEVTSIIDNPGQDPHSFEADVRVQLALSKADIVIQNGGGYDDWATILLAGAKNDDAVVLVASDISGYDQSEGFNEHVWYDFPTMELLATDLAEQLADLEPEFADVFESNAADFIAGLDLLEQREADLAAVVDGAGAAITEPVPLYLLTSAGFVNVTPDEFSEAIEEGSDVPPLAMDETLHLFGDGTAAILVYNAQTTGPETERVLRAAEDAGTPIVAVAETLPADTHYLDWMGATLDSLEAAMAARD